jgi:hypothetical protein
VTRATRLALRNSLTLVGASYSGLICTLRNFTSPRNTEARSGHEHTYCLTIGGADSIEPSAKLRAFNVISKMFH